MTENEAIKAIEHDLEWHSKELQPKYKEVFRYAIQALEEIQQYRAIGLTPELIEAMQGHNVALINDLGEYQAIGTVEELKVLKEKATPMKHHHTRIDDISGEVRVSVCPNCLSIMYTHSEEYPNFCNSCGQKLDWD